MGLNVEHVETTTMEKETDRTAKNPSKTVT